MTNPWSKIKEFVHENDGNTDATLSLSMDELQNGRQKAHDFSRMDEWLPLNIRNNNRNQ